MSDLDAVILEAELIGQLKTVLELFTNFEKPANNWDLNEVQKRKNENVSGTESFESMGATSSNFRTSEKPSS